MQVGELLDLEGTWHTQEVFVEIDGVLYTIASIRIGDWGREVLILPGVPREMALRQRLEDAYQPRHRAEV